MKQCVIDFAQNIEWQKSDGIEVQSVTMRYRGHGINAYVSRIPYTMRSGKVSTCWQMRFTLWFYECDKVRRISYEISGTSQTSRKTLFMLGAFEMATHLDTLLARQE